MILHITDTHFGTERTPAVRALIDWAARHRPDLIVLSGDLTQRARAIQFDAARAFVQALCEVAGLAMARDVLVLPGNHDIPLFNLLARWIHPYRQYQRAFGDDLEPVLERDQLLLIGVNATRPWRHKDGEVSPEQIERVAHRLRGADARLRIVVTHQPLHVVDDHDRKDLLHGHQQALRAWAAAGADLLLAGHIHQSFVVPLRDVYPDLARDTWVVQTGTAVSTRTRDRVPNTLHAIVHGGGDRQRAQVQRWDFDERTRAFELVAMTRVPGVSAAPP